MKITTMWMTALTLTSIFLIFVSILKKENSKNKESNSQFECGFSAMNPSHIPFSFQFFLVSLLFLIFDIEIALVLAYPLEPKTMKNILNMTAFILILTIGLIYEWQKSKISWSS